nr:hypothetical protein [Chlamydiota bacterium]
MKQRGTKKLTTQADSSDDNTSDFSSGLELKPAPGEQIKYTPTYDLGKVPDCAEGCVRQLALLLENKLSSTMDMPSSSSGDVQDEQIKLVSSRLRVHLEREELMSKEIGKSLEMLDTKILCRDFTRAKDENAKIKRLLIPFDIEQMRILYEKSLQAGALLKGEEVILFLGETGAGKSSTIHYLAGSKFELREQILKKSKILYMSPVKLPEGNMHLRNVTVSPTAASETRYITAVPIDCGKMGDPFLEGRLVLCDAPGFGDTAGVEVDVANGLGLVEAMRECKSVRLFILVSQEGMGDRMQGVKLIAHRLLSLIPNIGDVLSSITYGFTKYETEEGRRNIPGKIESVYKELIKEEGVDRLFKDVVLDMGKKTRSRTLVVDLKSNQEARNQLLSALKDATPVADPASIFAYDPKAEAREAIAGHVYKCRRSLDVALKSGDYPLAAYQLDQLAFLHRLFAVDASYREAYEEGVEVLLSTLNGVTSQAESDFQRCMQDDYPLRLEDVQAFQEALKALDEAHPLIERHLDPSAPDIAGSGRLHQCLEIAIGELRRGIEEASPRDEHVTKRLEKLVLLKEHFPSCAGPQYDASVRALISPIQVQAGDFGGLSDALSSHEYQMIGERLIALNRFISNLDDKSSTKAQGLQALEKVRALIVERITSAVSINFNQKHVLRDHFMGQIKECAEQLESLVSCQALVTGMGPLEGDLRHLHVAFWEGLQKFFEGRQEKIKVLYKDQKHR